MERENPKNLAELQCFFSETREMIENQLFPLAQKYGNREAMKALRQAWLRLLQGPVRVLFLGVSSAGKSTLINAMIGRIVVPEGRHTTSPVPVWIQSSKSAQKSPHIRIVREGEVGSLPELSNQGSGDFIGKYCYTPREAASNTAQEKYRGLIAATVDVLFQAGPGGGLTLIDAPGINVSVGDNLRVEDVLAQGCEMIVIVFQGMPQSDEEYLRQLLVDDGGLLHPLLKSGRVFAVHNWVSHLGTEATAKAHIGKLFGAFLPPEHFYMINALKHRLKSAGMYEFPHFLREGVTDEEVQEADAAYANEEKRMKTASLQPDLDKLWADLQARGHQLTECSEEVAGIIAPIRDGVNGAIGLLEKQYDQEIKKIRKSGLGTNQEKVGRCETIQGQLINVIAAEGYLKEAFDDADENSLISKWIKETQTVFPQLLSFVKSRPELQGYRMICDESHMANQVLLEGIEESDWVSTLVDGLLPYRAAGMNPAFAEALLSTAFREKVQAFTQIFQRKVQEVDQYLVERDLSTSVLQVTPEDIAKQIEMLHVKTVRQSAPYFSLALDRETKSTLRNYLADKQKRINSGKLLSRLSRAFLDTNLEVDQLNPYVRGRVERSMDRYAETMGLHLRSAAKDMGEQYRLALENKRLALEHQISSLEVQIKTERKAVQKAEISKIEEQRQKIQALRI